MKFVKKVNKSISEMIIVKLIFLCITKKEVKLQKYRGLVIVSDGYRHPVECHRVPSHTHKIKRREKTYKIRAEKTKSCLMKVHRVWTKGPRAG